MGDLAPDLWRTGLTALCGVPARQTNDKHWGAAVLAAGFLVADNDLAQPAIDAIEHQLRELVRARSRWFPDPIRSGGGETADIVAAITLTAPTLSLLGHGTIFATLALRTMLERPELATRANVDAIVEMTHHVVSRGPGGPFPGWDDPAAVRVEDDDGIAALASVVELARESAAAFSRVGTVYDGFDRGVVHHVLTHAHALVQLDALGFGEAARAGIPAHRTYLKLLGRRPAAGDDPLPDRADPIDFASGAYWSGELRGRSDWLFGHAFKVPLAWLALAGMLDPAVRHNVEPFLAATLTPS